MNFHICSALSVSRFKIDLRLQSHRSWRIILCSIRWRFVIFDKAGSSGTCPTWICTPSSLPSLLCCELRDEFFASQFFRFVHREMVLASSRSPESIKHQTDLCFIRTFCLKVESMFRKYSTQCLSSSMSNSCGIILWK